MNEIEIKKYQTYEYKGLKIGIWKTANRKFIRRSWAAIYFGDRKYLSDRVPNLLASFRNMKIGVEVIPMSPIQLVVFDMAGTTVKDENEVFDCFMEAAGKTDLVVVDGDRLNSMMGWAKKLVFQTLWAEQIGREHSDYESKVEASCEPVRLHVEAKKYLCAVDSDYWESLSSASKQSLEWQGGIFSEAEAEKFIAQPYASQAVRLRHWDDLAKVVDLSTPDLDHFFSIIPIAFKNKH